MGAPTLKDYRESYYSASVKASDIARQLGFAGIALIWIFQRTEKDVWDSYSLPEQLSLPTLFIVTSLILDLLQYVYKSAAWGWLQRRLELKHGPDITAEYIVSKYWNWPTLGFFWSKFLAVGIAYVLLFSFVLEHVRFSAGNVEPFTLYRNSIHEPNARLHVGTFGNIETSKQGKFDCDKAREFMSAQAGNKMRYWCEAGPFKK